MLEPTMVDGPDDEVVSDEELLFDDDVRVEWSQSAFDPEALFAPLEAEQLPSKSAIVVEGDVLVGKYRVERIPGRSGLGVVVDVKHVDLSQELTLKYLAADACSQPRYVKRFFREARDAVRMDGEHVAKVMDVGRLEFGAPYMVRESLRGPDLSEVVRVRGQLPLAEAVDYVIQTCEAVAEGHALGIVHRNLRPTTLVATRRYDGPSRVKVFDFGAAEALHFDPLTDGGLSLIGTNAILSSVPYMAPEQIRDPYDVDARVDVYALGAILHELLSGAPAITGQNGPALLAAAVADAPVALRTLREDVPAELEGVVLRCLAKDREQRFASVAELALALEPFASKDSVVSVHRVLRLARHPSAASFEPAFSVRPPAPAPFVPPIPAPSPTGPRETLRYAEPITIPPPAPLAEVAPIAASAPAVVTTPLSAAAPAPMGWFRAPAPSQTNTTMLPQRNSLHPLAASWAPPTANAGWSRVATWGSLAGCLALLLFLLAHKPSAVGAPQAASQGATAATATATVTPSPVVPSVMAAVAPPPVAPVAQATAPVVPASAASTPRAHVAPLAAPRAPRTTAKPTVAAPFKSSGGVKAGGNNKPSGDLFASPN